MSKDKKPFFKFPINLDVDIQDKDIKVRKILEFVPGSIKPNDAQVVIVPKWDGLRKTAFVVLNIDGKEISVTQLKESSEEESTEEVKSL